jgi:hypothetical protein
MKVVLFSTDLMLYSSVSSAAVAAGHSFQSDTNIDALASVLQDPDTILCLDLNVATADPTVLAASLHPTSLARSIAFGPHVHTEKLKAASAAGFGHVMPRGQFVAQVGSLLKH